MSAIKRPALPLVLTANDLLEGDVLFHDGGQWSTSLSEALVARDPGVAERLETLLASAAESGAVVEPYLVTVAERTDGGLEPGHYRERIRSLGPTIRSDLGPQAGQEPRHVPS